MQNILRNVDDVIYRLDILAARDNDCDTFHRLTDDDYDSYLISDFQDIQVKVYTRDINKSFVIDKSQI